MTTPTQTMNERAREVFDAVIKALEIQSEWKAEDICNNLPVREVFAHIRFSLIQAETIEVLRGVRDAMQEVIRISDRKTDAWDKAKEQLSALNKIIGEK